MEELFYRYNPWWEKSFELKGVINRPNPLNELKKQFSTKDIVFLTGLRRIGKTTLLKLFIEYLLVEKSIDPKHIFYISLDDYSLLKTSIHEIVEEYRKIHKISFKDKIYLFFDEIVYQDKFEQQLKNFYDNQNVKIYASSSSASILKSKKPFLTGRYKIVEILPLFFEEYLDFKGIKVGKSDKHLLEKYFEDYLETGGIPEYVLRGEMEYLKELVDDIIYKDIAAVHQVKNPQILKDFFLLLMERAGKQCSLNKMANILGISVDSAKRYLDMFRDTFLIYTLPRCGKTNERLLSAKKIYAADLGIKSLFTGFRDKGSFFENYVYLKIKDKNPCYLYKDGLEIDFLTEDKTLIEVKYNHEMDQKQQRLFRETPASKKILINSYKDLK